MYFVVKNLLIKNVDRSGDPELLDAAFRPLPLGSILPNGWLREQLRTQASGLAGHLDLAWPDVADSAWRGGTAEGWERAPYFLDGFVPLAYLLEDDALIARVRSWIDEILSRQREDGWLGPTKDDSEDYRKAYDPWPIFVCLKALTQYADASGDARIGRREDRARRGAILAKAGFSPGRATSV